MITKYIAEEEKLKKEKNESVLLSIQSKSHSGKDSVSQKRHRPIASKQSQGVKGHGNNPDQNHFVGGPKVAIEKNIKYFYCKKKGYIRSQCYKFKS